MSGIVVRKYCSINATFAKNLFDPSTYSLSSLLLCEVFYMLGLVFLLHISLEYLRKMENGWVLLILEVFSLSVILISIESDVTSILLMLILEKSLHSMCRGQD